MLSSSDGQRQDGCLLNIQDKQELTGLKGYFPGNLVESTWEDESTIDEYVTPGPIFLKETLATNCDKKLSRNEKRSTALIPYYNKNYVSGKARRLIVFHIDVSEKC